MSDVPHRHVSPVETVWQTYRDALLKTDAGRYAAVSKEGILAVGATASEAIERGIACRGCLDFELRRIEPPVEVPLPMSLYLDGMCSAGTIR